MDYKQRNRRRAITKLLIAIAVCGTGITLAQTNNIWIIAAGFAVFITGLVILGFAFRDMTEPY